MSKGKRYVAKSWEKASYWGINDMSALPFEDPFEEIDNNLYQL